MKRFELVLVVGCALLLAACGDPGTGVDTTTSSIDLTTSTTMASTITTETFMPSESDLVDVAIADLATRLGVSEEEVEVLRVEAVTWPDASLGCPRGGEVYAQVIVEGSRVLLQTDERVYDYHAGDDGEIFFCPSDERDGGYDFVPPPGDVER
jgi:hypothetical protein